MKTPPEQPAGSAAEATEARTPVTKDLLFRRALAIVDAEGLSALTMRRLAADLGVEAASLYHHVPNKQAVLDGAVSVMREDMVRVGMGTADIRYRGEFRNWSTDLTITYNANGKYSIEQIINIINAGGYSCGIGEWRPERDGQNGMFHVGA